MQRFNLLIVEPLQHTLKRHIQQADHLFCGGNIDLKSFAIIAHIGQHVCYIDISDRPVLVNTHFSDIIEMYVGWAA